MSMFLEDKKNPDTEEVLPWLVFKLNNLTYTINSRIVTSIVQLDDTVTPVASAPPIFRGVLNYRGDIIPLLDMRKLFGKPTVEEESISFSEIINARKQEHVDFVNEVEHCIDTGEPFSKTFDPNACKLGHWINHLKSEKTISFKFIEKNFREIVKPHALIHEIAKEIFECLRDTEMRKRKFEELKNQRQIVLALLDDMITSYNESYREMAVIASDDKIKLGLIVDEVVAVDELEVLSDADNFPTFQKTKFFTGIAESTKVEGEILLVNENMLMGTFDQYKDAV